MKRLHDSLMAPSRNSAHFCICSASYTLHAHHYSSPIQGMDRFLVQRGAVSSDTIQNEWKAAVRT